MDNSAFVIFATIATAQPQSEFVAALQAAYDGGAAGSFETRAVPGGFMVAFHREREANGIAETVEQLALELETSDIPAEADCLGELLSDFADQVRATGWLPFPPLVLAEG